MPDAPLAFILHQMRLCSEYRAHGKRIANNIHEEVSAQDAQHDRDHLSWDLHCLTGDRLHIVRSLTSLLPSRSTGPQSEDDRDSPCNSCSSYASAL